MLDSTGKKPLLPLYYTRHPWSVYSEAQKTRTNTVWANLSQDVKESIVKDLPMDVPPSNTTTADDIARLVHLYLDPRQEQQWISVFTVMTRIELDDKEARNNQWDAIAMAFNSYTDFRFDNCTCLYNEDGTIEGPLPNHIVAYGFCKDINPTAGLSKPRPVQSRVQQLQPVNKLVRVEVTHTQIHF
eukprot:scaffold858_cov171-Ochromonas_danica.AAC.1